MDVWGWVLFWVLGIGVFAWAVVMILAVVGSPGLLSRISARFSRVLSRLRRKRSVAAEPVAAYSLTPSLPGLSVSGMATILQRIGVGVYQGEVVAIRELGLSTLSHQWVVSTLHSSDFRQIDKNTVQLLYCLALLLSSQISSSPVMPDSQSRQEVKMNVCPLMNLPGTSLLPPCVAEGGNGATPDNQELQQLEALICQLCQSQFYYPCCSDYMAEKPQGQERRWVSVI